MAAIRSKGNKTTEIALIKGLRSCKITGWRRHYPIKGKPDFVFLKNRLAVYVDGCFWHGCSQCFQLPKTNKIFWRTKINANVKRDKKVKAFLKMRGWSVYRIPEHILKKRPQTAINGIINILKLN